MNRTTEKIPTWSLCYLINGDATALTDDEIRMVDEWVSQWQVEIVSPLMDEDGSTLFIPVGCYNINIDRKSTRLNSSHNNQSRMPSSA